jgi:opacity protein-like surface antigen
MMLRRTMALSGLTVVCLAAAGAPVLADSGFYVGATAGQSIFHQDRSEADAAIMDAFSASGFNVVNGSSSIDKTDFAFGGLVGYRFMPNVSVEAAYVDLGKLSYKFSGRVAAFTTILANANLFAKAKGPTLALLGSLPLSPAWEVYGRAGIFFSKVTLTAETTLSVPSSNLTTSGRDSSSANSVDPLVGVGVGWHVSKHMALRAEYTRFANVGDKDKTGETNIDLVDLGVTYSFP